MDIKFNQLLIKLNYKSKMTDPAPVTEAERATFTGLITELFSRFLALDAEVQAADLEERDEYDTDEDYNEYTLSYTEDALNFADRPSFDITSESNNNDNWEDADLTGIFAAGGDNSGSVNFAEY